MSEEKNTIKPKLFSNILPPCENNATAWRKPPVQNYRELLRFRRCALRTGTNNKKKGVVRDSSLRQFLLFGLYILTLVLLRRRLHNIGIESYKNNAILKYVLISVSNFCLIKMG